MPLDKVVSRLRRNMPNPMPAIILGRLAVDNRLKGQHLGAALLKDAINRASIASEYIGATVLLVHALNEEVKPFYLHYGFTTSLINPLLLMLKL